MPFATEKVVEKPDFIQMFRTHLKRCSSRELTKRFPKVTPASIKKFILTMPEVSNRSDCKVLCDFHVDWDELIPLVEAEINSKKAKDGNQPQAVNRPAET